MLYSDIAHNIQGQIIYIQFKYYKHVSTTNFLVDRLYYSQFRTPESPDSTISAENMEIRPRTKYLTSRMQYRTKITVVLC